MAHFIDSVAKFQRGVDPKKAMDIGMSNDEIKKKILIDRYPDYHIEFETYYDKLVATVWSPNEAYPKESDFRFDRTRYYWDDKENKWKWNLDT